MYRITLVKIWENPSKKFGEVAPKWSSKHSHRLLLQCCEAVISSHQRTPTLTWSPPFFFFFLLSVALIQLHQISLNCRESRVCTLISAITPLADVSQFRCDEVDSWLLGGKRRDLCHTPRTALFKMLQVVKSLLKHPAGTKQQHSFGVVSDHLMSLSTPLLALFRTSVTPEGNICLFRYLILGYIFTS